MRDICSSSASFYCTSFCSDLPAQIYHDMLTFYFHAYQSFVFNHMASRRIKEFGLQPIVGDLVRAADIPDEDVEGDDEEKGDENDQTADESASPKGEYH